MKCIFSVIKQLELSQRDYGVSLCYLSASQSEMHKEMEKSHTNDSQRFLRDFYECCWNHPLSEAALLAGAPQKVCEEYESKFHSGWVKVGLQEEQEPVATQDTDYGHLLSKEGQEQNGLIQLKDHSCLVMAYTQKHCLNDTSVTQVTEYVLIHNKAIRVEGFKKQEQHLVADPNNAGWIKALS